jgi:flagellar biosynthesis/type III secretory pathway M-ring protein FliF/YscJ
MNEKWRDYRKYTDQQLDDLLKGFVGHADYGAVVFEYQRRQNVRREAESKARHEKTQHLARWAMIFALSGVVGIVFGLIQNCSNKSPSSATQPEASTSPPITPLQQTEAQEPRQTSAISPPEQPPTEPITTSTPEETPQEPAEQPIEEQPEESPTPSS